MTINKGIILFIIIIIIVIIIIIIIIIYFIIFSTILNLSSLRKISVKHISKQTFPLTLQLAVSVLLQHLVAQHQLFSKP